MDTIAGQAAVAVDHFLLYRGLKQREAHLDALHGITVQASQSLDLQTVTAGVIQKITEVFDFDATRIYLYDESMEEMRPTAQFDRDPVELSKLRSFPTGRGLVGEVVATGEPLVFEDVTVDPVYRARAHSKSAERSGRRFLAAFPVKGKHRSLGAVVCSGVAPRRLSASEIQLLASMAGQLAVAVENASLYQAVNDRANELQKKTWELEVANKVKDEFLSVMSHELRTPLSVIMGYTGMLKEGMLGEINPKQEDALHKVLNRATDQLGMINDVMQTTQIEAREVRPDLHPVDLCEFFRGLKADYDSAVENNSVALSWDYPSEPTPIATDSGKLRQILRNLINNAVKFTDKGTVHVTAKAGIGAQELGIGAASQSETPNSQSLTPNPRRWVEVAVTDTGVGIPPDRLYQIFDKFYQVDSSETRLYGGVGLGLYIAKKFAEMLGGEISVESEVGKGTTITVRLPG